MAAKIDATCSEMMADGKVFQQYLEVQGRFDRYSVNNAILVAAQMPEATQLKDYGSWKQSRVYVDKDAQKVTILEPGKEYERDDGSKAVGYNAKVVYDISQTSAKDRGQPQEAKTMRELVSAMIDASPVNFQPVEELELPCLGKTRGMGLMIGVEVNEGWTNRELAGRLIESGLLVLTAGPGLRFLPPLTITQEEMDRGLSILKRTLG